MASLLVRVVNWSRYEAKQTKARSALHYQACPISRLIEAAPSDAAQLYKGAGMREATVAYLPWLLSAITIWMTVLAGNKHPSAWAVGLVNQALWLGWIIASSAWGLLPMNIALWIVYARNHLKWSASEKGAVVVPAKPVTLKDPQVKTG